MLKTIYKLINVIYREKNTCTVYTVLQSRGKDKVLLLGFPGLHKIVGQLNIFVHYLNE